MSRCTSNLCKLNGCMFPQACPIVSLDDIRETIAPNAPDPGQTHYEGCERTAGHHRCAVDALDRAREALRVVHDELYSNASVSLEFAAHDLTSKRHHTELTVGLVSEAQESIKRALATTREEKANV